jgi:nucleoside-diphosphate-sugar epimerase
MEDRLSAAGYEHVVLRFPPFMECWLALVGSSIPLRGEPFATVGRPSPFLRRFRALTGSSIEAHGVMLVPGRPTNRNAFIAGPDVAAACVEAVERPDVANRVVEVGGPEILTWLEVAALYEEILHRRVRVVSTPTAVYTAASSALSPVAPVPAATMALNRLLAGTETPWRPGGGGLLDPATMLTVREFLRAKAALPDALPEVA